MSSQLLERASHFRTLAAKYIAKAEVLEKAEPEIESAMSDDVLGVVAVTTPKRSTPTPSATQTGKRRGRPVGSKNKVEDGGKVSVKSLVLDILRKNRGGMSIADVVKECLSAGYETKSKNFTNVVYQNLNTLMKQEKKVVLNREEKLWKLAS